MFADDTITAVATAVGEGGIGIVRVSGACALEIAAQLFKSPKDRLVQEIKNFSAAYGNIIDPDTQDVVDEVLLLVMRGPHSYTCEDVVEIHCHGGPVALQKILSLTLNFGARLAEPGEFTKRAFLNGRLDLTQAEAVIDVIRAKTDASLNMAIGHLSGRLSAKLKEVRHKILGMIAQLEAAIDFPEEDIEEASAQKVSREVEEVLVQLEHLLATAQTGKILRDGLKTVIIGKPNVGKSSLLNALVGEKKAIVTDVPGTTRDIIEEYLNIKGIPLKIIDTAGIRETQDIVEKIGVDRAKEIMEQADLILLLLDSSLPLSQEDIKILEILKDKRTLVLINKSDLPQQLDISAVIQFVPSEEILRISAAQGTGLEEVEQAIVDKVYSGHVVQAEGAFVNNARHEHLLHQAREHLIEVLSTIRQGMPTDCIVVDLRAAWDKLGEITGDTVGEDIIEQIFTQFCIGK